jgi:hypothetical protein
MCWSLERLHLLESFCSFLLLEFLDYFVSITCEHLLDFTSTFVRYGFTQYPYIFWNPWIWPPSQLYRFRSITLSKCCCAWWKSVSTLHVKTKSRRSKCKEKLKSTMQDLDFSCTSTGQSCRAPAIARLLKNRYFKWLIDFVDFRWLWMNYVESNAINRNGFMCRTVTTLTSLSAHIIPTVQRRPYQKFCIRSSMNGFTIRRSLRAKRFDQIWTSIQHRLAFCTDRPHLNNSSESTKWSPSTKNHETLTPLNLQNVEATANHLKSCSYLLGRSLLHSTSKSMIREILIF